MVSKRISKSPLAIALQSVEELTPEVASKIELAILEKRLDIATFLKTQSDPVDKN